MAEITQDEEDITVGRLPVGSAGRKSSGWYGVIALMATEGSLFVYLLFSYYYFWVWADGSFLPFERPDLKLAAPDTIILILSSVAAWWGERGIKRNRAWQLPLGLGIAIVLGVIFLGVQYFEWLGKTFRPDTSSYGSLYFTTTGFHMAHVAFGVLVLLALFVWSLLGMFNTERHAPVTIGILYWHFVDVVWLFIFFTFYITPYLT
jgi:heme/copper-type cytochrome/quinol oxidase subunit 3